MQYGPTVRSVAAYLVAGHHLPLGRAAGVLGDLLAAPVSPGSISRWLGVAADRLAPFLTTLRDQFAAAEVVHFDETGLQVDGRLGWVHSASTATLSLFTPPPSGAWPRWMPPACCRRCAGSPSTTGGNPTGTTRSPTPCANHLRELTAVAEQPDQTWAIAMTDLLLSAHQLVADATAAGETALDPAVLADLHSRYTATLAVGRSINPAPGDGRRRQTLAGNLIDRLETHRDDVLRFTTDFRVPSTNNQAEQDIRMVKIRQKISGCLRSWHGARTFCALRSYLSTANKQRQPTLTALRSLFNGHPWLPATE